MNLKRKQINELCTGVVLITELNSSRDDLRKFISVYGYSYDENGNFKKLNNVIKDDYGKVYFILKSYEIPKEYIDNEWYVTEDDLENLLCVKDIKGIDELEVELKKFIEDFSLLKPEWYSDAIYC